MKIAVVTNNFPSQSETFISNKVICFAENGNEVIVFCNNFNKASWMKIRNGKQNVFIEEINRASLSAFLLLHPFLLLKGNSSRNIAAGFFLQRIKKYQADVVHFEFSGIGIYYADVLKKLTCKKVVSCRGSAEKVKLLTDISRKEKIKKLFDDVDLIHCVSNDMKQTVLPYCNDPEKIFINYPGVDITAFQRNETYAFHQQINILSIGRMTFQKGYLTGLLAIKKLKESYQNFKWTIVGDGAQKEEIIFHINEMKLREHVMLVGAKSKDEIIELYNKADIFLLPSVYEGIANVALEAMSMELPIVSTRSGGMEEVITHEVNGMLADVYDSDKLAEHLLQLINTEMLCKIIGGKGRERVAEQFTIQQQIEKFKKIYSSEQFNIK